VIVAAFLEIGHFEKPDAANDPDGEDGPCVPGPTIPVRGSVSARVIQA